MAPNTIPTGLARDTKALMGALGMTEEPMGIFYTHQKPAKGLCPRPQTPLHRLAEDKDGGIHWNSCVLGKVRRARREKVPAYFDQERYGCLGGAFFMGFKSDYESFEPGLLSTGIPGKMEGEHYVDSPETGRRFYEKFQPPRAASRVLVIQPLSLFTKDQKPEIVVFFPDRNAMIGLNALTTFLTQSTDAVRMPFGVGCCAMISWPRKFLQQGKKRAVIGGFDLNGIKYLKKGEVTYAVPYTLFKEMLDNWPGSVLGTRAWKRLRP